MSGIAGPPRKEPHKRSAPFELPRADFLDSLVPELQKQILRDVVPTHHAMSVEVRHEIASQALGKRRRGAA